MTQEAQLTKRQKDEVYALDVISQMLYTSKISLDFLDLAHKTLPQSSLKDTVLIYMGNQKDWTSRLMRALKGFSSGGVDLVTAMQADLDGMEIYVFFDIIRNLKSVRHLEGVAAVVEELTDLDDVEPIFTQLKAIIRNEKNRQGC